MRRNELIKSLTVVKNAVVSTGIDSLFNEIRTKQPAERIVESPIALSAYSNFIMAYTNFNPIEKQILSSFELDILHDINFWSRLMDKGSDEIGLLFSVRTNSQALSNAIDKIIPLLSRTSDFIETSVDGVNSEGVTKKIELKTLTFIIKEDKNVDISIDNLLEILNSIKSIFEVICRVHSIDRTELFIGSIDSGSDKSIDIIGIAEAVNKSSAFIMECWDRFRFRKEQKLDKSFKTMTEGLSVIDKIQSSVDSNSISVEEAEKLKRSVIKSMDTLIGNGVYTPEAESRAIPLPSQIPVERRLMIEYQDPDTPRKIVAKKNVPAKVEKRARPAVKPKA